MASSKLGRFQIIVNGDAPVQSVVADGIREDVVAGFYAESQGDTGQYTDEINEVRAWVREQFGNRYAISWWSSRNKPAVYYDLFGYEPKVLIQFWFTRHADAAAFRIRWG